MKLFACMLIAAFSAAAEQPVRGFAPEAAGNLRAFEIKARAIPDPARARGYMERMSAEPHHAGSPASKAVAMYALGLLKEWGLDARIEEFEALLPYPTARSLEMTAPVKFRALLQEPAVGEDGDSRDRNQLPTYNAYSASGEASAPLVYVNYGIPQDYEELKKLGVDVKGKIVIARYGQSWRGTKVKVAQEHGAVGCLIYSDPRDDGYFQGDVYPKGAFRPPHGVQRGSVMDMPLYVGDPLSPGWASEKGARKLSMSEAGSVMKIPVLPISYADAQPLLQQLAGPVAPEAWRGALPITYHIGPGPAAVTMKTGFDWTSKPLYNVIATIPGSTWPDEWILYGNHHDAWVNGAMDPVSGAAALLESARTLAELRKQGWKPKRTIKFALWDGEEFGLVGSTEWVEKHAAELRTKAVAYFNSDSNGKGALGVGATPSLEAFLAEILRDIPDPGGKSTLLETARAREAADTGKEPAQGFRVGALGAGSDYVAFYHHLGIASANIGFGSSGFGGIYHSIYDSSHWYRKFSDGDFSHSRALSQVMATALLRIADASLLPFEFSAFTVHAGLWMDEIRKLPGGPATDMSGIAAELDRLKESAARYEAAARSTRWHAASAGNLARVNAVVFRAERALLDDAGLSGRSWYKHRLSAPGVYTGYSAKTLPGVRESVEAGRVEEATREAAKIAAALGRLRVRIDEAASLLGQENLSR